MRPHGHSSAVLGVTVQQPQLSTTEPESEYLKMSQGLVLFPVGSLSDGATLCPVSALRLAEVTLPMLGAADRRPARRNVKGREAGGRKTAEISSIFKKLCVEGPLGCHCVETVIRCIGALAWTSGRLRSQREEELRGQCGPASPGEAEPLPRLPRPARMKLGCVSSVPPFCLSHSGPSAVDVCGWCE